MEYRTERYCLDFTRNVCALFIRRLFLVPHFSFAKQLAADKIDRSILFEHLSFSYNSQNEILNQITPACAHPHRSIQREYSRCACKIVLTTMAHVSDHPNARTRTGATRTSTGVLTASSPGVPRPPVLEPKTKPIPRSSKVSIGWKKVSSWDPQVEVLG